MYIGYRQKACNVFALLCYGETTGWCSFHLVPHFEERSTVKSEFIVMEHLLVNCWRFELAIKCRTIVPCAVIQHPIMSVPLRSQMCKVPNLLISLKMNPKACDTGGLLANMGWHRKMEVTSRTYTSKRGIIQSKNTTK